MGSTFGSIKNEPEYAETKSKCSPDYSLNEALLESIYGFTSDYNSISNIGKNFLDVSATILVSDVNFKGLSMEAAPYLDRRLKSRSDFYLYNDQKLRICLREFGTPLKPVTSLSTLMIHEMTHAIDDYCNMGSCRTFFKVLDEKNKTQNFDKPTFLACSADIVDDEANTFTKSYLDDLNKQLPKDNEISNIANNYGHSFITVKGNRRGLTCPPECTEFLTFSVEQIFDALSSSDTTEQFSTNYNNIIETSISKAAAHQYSPPEILSSAFGLIKDTTVPHLQLIKEHAERDEQYHELAKCCDAAMNSLETKHNKLIEELTDERKASATVAYETKESTTRMIGEKRERLESKNSGSDNGSCSSNDIQNPENVSARKSAVMQQSPTTEGKSYKEALLSGLPEQMDYARKQASEMQNKLSSIQKPILNNSVNPTATKKKSAPARYTGWSGPS